MVVEETRLGESYPLRIAALAHNPVASTTYYLGARLGPPTVTPAICRAQVPKTGYVVGARINIQIDTPGSGEFGSVALRVNDTTDYLLGFGFVKWDLAFASYPGSIPSDILLAEGDYVEFKVATAAWPVISPVGVYYWGGLWIDSRAAPQ